MTTDFRAPQPRESLSSLAASTGCSDEPAPLWGGYQPEPLRATRPIDRDIDHGCETEQPHTANSALS